MDPDVIGGIGHKLYSELKGGVVGQDKAVDAVVSAYRQTQAGLGIGNGPVASFLFLGPTGSGKTLLAEATAEVLSGIKDTLLKVDCAEYQHSQDIAKLIGAPPGYIGHKETIPLLSQKSLSKSISKNCSFSFVLFDEIEKANEALWNLLLGILDKGKIRNGSNQEVDFSRTLVFMTSNLGADAIDKLLRPPMGLAPPVSAEEAQSKMAKLGIEAAKKKFTPEFNNRIDYTVTFRPLDRNDLRQILDLELNMLQDGVFARCGQNSYMFAVSPIAREKILDQGTDAKYGARFLKRILRKLVVAPLSNMVCSGQLRPGDMALVDWKDGEFEFYKHFEGLSTLEMGWAQSLIYAEGVAVPTKRQMKAIREPVVA